MIPVPGIELEQAFREISVVLGVGLVVVTVLRTLYVGFCRAFAAKPDSNLVMGLLELEDLE